VPAHGLERNVGARNPHSGAGEHVLEVDPGARRHLPDPVHAQSALGDAPRQRPFALGDLGQPGVARSGRPSAIGERTVDQQPTQSS
jgi:hypothetical protein